MCAVGLYWYRRPVLPHSTVVLPTVTTHATRYAQHAASAFCRLPYYNIHYPLLPATYTVATACIGLRFCHACAFAGVLVRRVLPATHAGLYTHLLLHILPHHPGPTCCLPAYGLDCHIPTTPPPILTLPFRLQVHSFLFIDISVLPQRIYALYDSGWFASRLLWFTVARYHALHYAPPHIFVLVDTFTAHLRYVTAIPHAPYRFTTFTIRFRATPPARVRATVGGN